MSIGLDVLDGKPVPNEVHIEHEFLDKASIALGLPLRPAGKLRPMAEPLLELTGVSKTFGPVVALDRVDLTIGAAEAVGLIGDNGAGKSTLVKILSGLFPPTTGTIRFDGSEVAFAARSMPAPPGSR